MPDAGEPWLLLLLLLPELSCSTPALPPRDRKAFAVELATPASPKAGAGPGSRRVFVDVMGADSEDPIEALPELELKNPAAQLTSGRTPLWGFFRSASHPRIYSSGAGCCKLVGMFSCTPAITASFRYSVYEFFDVPCEKLGGRSVFNSLAAISWNQLGLSAFVRPTDFDSLSRR